MNIEQRIEQWLTEDYDNETKKIIRLLQKENPTELKEAFYKELDFGTGGLRGIMGVGSNHMNKYTVGFATQGFANYLLETYKNKNISVAIAYDCRNNSEYFANIAADVLSANNIKTFLFDKLRPTPELSFAVRHLKCNAGIVITASHNPKEYNGYKVYWNDGGQLVPPHDKNVITNVRKISNIKQVKFERNKDLIEIIGENIDNEYISKIAKTVLASNAIKKQSNIPIVYTPLHGAGVHIVPKALKKIGFKNIINVPEQDINDGNFPTISSPNPEEKAAMKMAISKAKATNAKIIIATDPDTDRVGVGIKNQNGDYTLLNGNQTATILTYYKLLRLKELNIMPKTPFIVKTIVTTDILDKIASDFGAECYEVLTGFKYIAEIIKQNEGQKNFIGGGEESYGYLWADFVRDKDAVMTSCLVAEVAAWTAEYDKNILDLLEEIYNKYGFYLEDLISITKKGIRGQEEIENIMKEFRENPPKSLANIEIESIKDYLISENYNLKNKTKTPISLPKSDVLQFFLCDGSKITMRPSGTEPKIKFYFSAFTKNKMITREEINEKISQLKKHFLQF